MIIIVLLEFRKRPQEVVSLKERGRRKQNALYDVSCNVPLTDTKEGMEKGNKTLLRVLRALCLFLKQLHLFPHIVPFVNTQFSLYFIFRQPFGATISSIAVSG